ncbi:hypothetical protein B0A55_03458 [Friedmanniomyces simplex]|uniref:Ribosome biogenesis protein NOP53 n=1 Tax=Friedmanniomyces simplex TaxID=329884 RepID=A0A4U0XUZ5_9PEZI|nr:hypothetical protein B0A55_03458 [Friedmanniomyces simplex]
MAPAPVTAPATHKQPSRKGKKAWRKNVDISAVQTGLEDVRDEIVKHGGVVAEKEADQLFATDLTGDAEIAKKQTHRKPSKADEIWRESKRYKNGDYVSHKELLRLKSIADNAAGGVAVEESAAHDPWAPVTVTKDPRFTYLDEAQPTRAPKTLAQAPISLAADGKTLPNVRKPEAGKSYNPLVTDWSALLEREARALAEAEKVDKQDRDEYGTDHESAWESEWEGFQSGAEDGVHVKKMVGRKTPAERNKVKARKEREAREKWEVKQKERNVQEKRIAQIAREMSVKDKARNASRHSFAAALEGAASDSDADDDDKEVPMQRRRFGRLPIPNAPLEVVLPDELQDSLRRLKPEGNLLTDRFRNLLVNGKVEVRRKQFQWKLGKTERFEKWSYKDWTLK